MLSLRSYCQPNQLPLGTKGIHWLLWRGPEGPVEGTRRDRAHQELETRQGGVAHRRGEFSLTRVSLVFTGLGGRKSGNISST